MLLAQSGSASSALALVGHKVQPITRTPISAWVLSGAVVGVGFSALDGDLRVAEAVVIGLLWVALMMGVEMFRRRRAE
jgi:hypothetical protein